MSDQEKISKLLKGKCPECEDEGCLIEYDPDIDTEGMTITVSYDCETCEAEFEIIGKISEFKFVEEVEKEDTEDEIEEDFREASKSTRYGMTGLWNRP